MKIAELEEILNHTICDKGCGEVEIQIYGDEPICSVCGEELFYDLTAAHREYLKKHCKNRHVETEE